jgi:tetratricopeptide (TPR) repeat protein
MKTIKIMIAASEEMHEEKLEFTNLIEHLNEVLEPRGIELKRIKWNPETDGTIEEYKAKLKECEMCLTLYWRDLSDNSEQELDAAFKELKNGNNPRNLYVFFKESTEDLTDALKDFKANFVINYGHFFCKFENVDTMNLHFILQFEAYQNRLGGSLVKIEQGKVSISNKPFVNLDNVPFVSLNAEHQRLSEDVRKCEEELCEIDNKFKLAPGSKKLKEEKDKAMKSKEEAEKNLNNHLSKLYNIAFSFAKNSFEYYSERMARAREQFEKGNIKEANAILKLDEIKKEANFELANFKQYQENLKIKVDEFYMKAQLIRSDDNNRSVGNLMQAKEAYDNAIQIAKQINYDKVNLAKITIDFADYLSYLSSNNFLVELQCRFVDGDISDMDVDQSGLKGLAEQYYDEGISLYRELSNGNGQHYLPLLASALVGMSDLKEGTQKVDSHREALNIYREVALPNDSELQKKVAEELMWLADNDSELSQEQRVNYYDEGVAVMRSLAESGENLGVIIYIERVADRYSEMGMIDKALNLYLEADQLYEKDSLCAIMYRSTFDIKLKIAGIYSERKEYSQQIAIYKKMLNSSITDEEIQFMDADLRRDHEHYTGQQNIFLYKLLGNAYLDQGNFSEAENAFSTGMALSEKWYDEEIFISLELDLANVCRKTGRLDEALKTYQNVMQRHKKNIKSSNLFLDKTFVQLGDILNVIRDEWGDNVYEREREDVRSALFEELRSDETGRCRIAGDMYNAGISSYRINNNYSLALTCFRETLNICSQYAIEGDEEWDNVIKLAKQELANVLSVIAYDNNDVQKKIEKTSEAIKLYTDIIEQYKDSSFRPILADTQYNLGIYYADIDLAKSEEALIAALRTYRQLEDKANEFQSLNAISIIMIKEEKWAKAKSVIEDALSLVSSIPLRITENRKLKQRYTGVVQQYLLAKRGQDSSLSADWEIYLRDENWENATLLSNVERAEALFVIAYHETDIARKVEVQSNVVGIYKRLSAQDDGFTPSFAKAQYNLGLYLSQHDKQSAEISFCEALNIYRQLDNKEEERQAMKKVALIQTEQQKWGEAKGTYEDIILISEQMELDKQEREDIEREYYHVLKSYLFKQRKDGKLESEDIKQFLSLRDKYEPPKNIFDKLLYYVSNHIIRWTTK